MTRGSKALGLRVALFAVASVAAVTVVAAGAMLWSRALAAVEPADALARQVIGALQNGDVRRARALGRIPDADVPDDLLARIGANLPPTSPEPGSEALELLRWRVIERLGDEPRRRTYLLQYLAVDDFAPALVRVRIIDAGPTLAVAGLGLERIEPERAASLTGWRAWFG